MGLNSPTGKRGMTFVGDRRLTATVVGLSQMAHDRSPSMVVLRGIAHSFPSWFWEEQGMTVTAPERVFLKDTMRTGLVFQNSGSWASLGKSHQKSCRISGLALRRGATRGGFSSSTAGYWPVLTPSGLI